MMLTTEQQKNKLEELLLRVRRNRAYWADQRTAGATGDGAEEALPELTPSVPAGDADPDVKAAAVPERTSAPAEATPPLTAASPEPSEAPILGLPSRSPEPQPRPAATSSADAAAKAPVSDTSKGDEALGAPLPSPRPTSEKNEAETIIPTPDVVEAAAAMAGPEAETLDEPFEKPEPSPADVAAPKPASRDSLTRRIRIDQDDLSAGEQPVDAPADMARSEPRVEADAATDIAPDDTTDLPVATEPPPVAAPSPSFAPEPLPPVASMAYHPQMASEGDVAVVRGELQPQWTLRAVLDRAWKLGAKE